MFAVIAIFTLLWSLWLLWFATRSFFHLITAHNRQHWDYSTGFRCCADTL